MLRATLFAVLSLASLGACVDGASDAPARHVTGPACVLPQSPPSPGGIGGATPGNCVITPSGPPIVSPVPQEATGGIYAPPALSRDDPAAFRERTGITP